MSITPQQRRKANAELRKMRRRVETAPHGLKQQRANELYAHVHDGLRARFGVQRNV